MKKRGYALIMCGFMALASVHWGACRGMDKEMMSEEIMSEEMKKETDVVMIPDNVAEYNGCTVDVNGTKLPLYQVMVNSSQTWNGNTQTREAAGVGYFFFEEETQVTLTLPYEIDYASKVRPLSEGIIPVADIENRTLKFEISRPGTYIVEPNNDRTKAIHIFALDQKEEIPKGDRVIYFGPGVHTSENSEHISADHIIRLSSGTTVYLDAGAVVRAKFWADHAADITIMGPGIIDGSQFTRNAYTGEVMVPLDLNYCSNVLLQDFSVLDPAGWCVNLYFGTDCRIEDIKIISSRSNGDGISIQSCKNVTVSDCFVRSWDDSLVVKNYPHWTDRSKHGETENILFENCILWTDLAQSMEIGYETVGEKMQGIAFRDITVLHALHRAVISIHNGNNAKISNVLYENITIEDASVTEGDTLGGNPVVEFTVAHNANWSDQHTITELGSISDITVKNLAVLGGSKNLSIGISGCVDKRDGYGGEHKIRNVLFDNVSVKGAVWTQETANIHCNGYTENIGFAE